MAQQQSPQEPDNTSFKEQRDILNEINSELGNQINNIKEATKSYSKLNSIAFKLQNSEEEISKLSGKQLQALKEKSQIALRELKDTAERLQKEKGISDLSAKALKKRKDLTTNERSLLTAANERFQIEENFVKKVEGELDSYNEINNKLGIFGGLLQGISKIPILGDVFDANQALDAARDKVKETGSGARGLAAGFKNVGSQLSTGVLNPANLLTGLITTFVQSLFQADQETGDLAKGMNMTYDQANKTRQELTQIANYSGDSALNTSRLQESLMAVNNALGTTGKLSESDLKTFTKLREQAGMTNEEILGMQKYSMATGGSLEDNVKSFQASAKIMSYQKGVALNTKKLMTEMSNVSSRTKLSIQGGAEGLAKAAVSAKLMGGNLEQVANIADQLLDFEQSIENELSAELLLGKDINLEKARNAALNNDLATVAEEITNQAGSAAEFSKMNRIQQEAMAKAVGMTADQLADTLVEQEALKAVGGALNDEEKKAFEAAKQKYGLEEASRMLKEGQLDEMVDQQSLQDQFNQQLEKMKEIFVTIAPAILEMGKGLMDVLSLVGNILSPIQTIFNFFGKIGSSISKLTGPLGTVGKILKGIASIAVIYAAYQAFAFASMVPIVGPVLGAAAAATVLAAGFGILSSIKDGVIDPKGGLVVSGEKGSIQLDPKDSIIAGTNLFGNKKEMNDGTIDPQGKMTSSGEKGSIKINSSVGNNTMVNKPNNSIDTTAIINAINNLANRPINVSIDGKKVIEATTGNQPNTVGDESRKNSYRVS
jgi:hypothetical protein